MCFGSLHWILWGTRTPMKRQIIVEICGLGLIVAAFFGILSGYIEEEQGYVRRFAIGILLGTLVNAMEFPCWYHDLHETEVIITGGIIFLICWCLYLRTQFTPAEYDKIHALTMGTIYPMIIFTWDLRCVRDEMDREVDGAYINFL